MGLRARLHAVGDLRVAQGPAVPAGEPGWSRIAVTSVGICGSDLHWFTEGGIGDTRIDRPVVPGHEFAALALSGPLAGRRVAVDPAIPCGRCTECRRGHGNLCPDVRFAGHGALDGGLQSEMWWPHELLHPLPDGLSDEAGALLEPLGVAMHAVKVAHLRPGADVLVVGGGPIGVLVAAVARRAGAARVSVSEPLEHRRTTALRFGADDAWTPEELAARTDEGIAFDVVVEMAGSDAGVADAVAAARPGARIALGGIPSTPLSSFPASGARRKGLTFAMVRRMHGTYPRAVELARTGVDLDALVTARFPLPHAAAAFAHAAGRPGDKTVVTVFEG